MAKPRSENPIKWDRRGRSIGYVRAGGNKTTLATSRQKRVPHTLSPMSSHI